MARVPTCLGRWSAAWRRQGWPPEAAPAARPGLGPPVPGWWAGRCLSMDFDLCSPRARLPFLVSRLPLGRFIWRRLFSRLVLHKGSVLCTSGAPSPWPSLLAFSFPCSSPGLCLDPCPLQPRAISGWLFLSVRRAAGFHLILASVGHVVSVNRGHSPTPERRRVTVVERGWAPGVQDAK